MGTAIAFYKCLMIEVAANPNLTSDQVGKNIKKQLQKGAFHRFDLMNVIEVQKVILQDPRIGVKTSEWVSTTQRTIDLLSKAGFFEKR